jgi:hypothetical protein
MKTKEIKQENEVYFLGSKNTKKKITAKKTGIGVGIFIVVVIILVAVILYNKHHTTPPYYFEPEDTEKSAPDNTGQHSFEKSQSQGYIEVLEETVNDVPMFVYKPHNATMTLAVGKPDKADSTILFIAQAADIRADNHDILGDFVLAGAPLSRGSSKTGFCAVINGKITVGMAKTTPLLQEAIQTKGYFFRQYMLVNNGELVENNPKNKTIRRALATRKGEIIVVESRSAESFHDFAQALVDIGISDAIYLIGSTSYGWYLDEENRRVEFGVEKDSGEWKISYVVWRKE